MSRPSVYLDEKTGGTTQLSVAQRSDGLDVIKIDSGHLIHFGFDDIRALPGVAPHDVIQWPANLRPADRTVFAAAAMGARREIRHGASVDLKSLIARQRHRPEPAIGHDLLTSWREDHERQERCFRPRILEQRQPILRTAPELRRKLYQRGVRQEPRVAIAG